MKKKVNAAETALRYVGEKIVQEVTGGVYEGRKKIGKYGKGREDYSFKDRLSLSVSIRLSYLKSLLSS